MTDWEWFLSSEGGRDRILRGQIEGLEDSVSSARSHSARLSSQLTQLQGSIETRLQALSAAFDAYVELGDVREQLAGYPDTSAIRRDAVTAIEVLSRGGRPDPLEHRDLDYWLSYAVNAVIALAAGNRDPDAERRAAELSPDAELFVVTAAGALGVGTGVGARVAPLLVCDGTLAPRQMVLFHAVLAGLYGPRLPEVGDVWRTGVETSPDHWTSWIRTHGRTDGPGESLRWLDTLTTPTPTPTAAPPPDSDDDAAPPPAADSRTGLRTAVIDLVGQGMGDEEALLARSRVLRARIEDPGSPAADDEPEVPNRPVTEVVQEALLAAAPGSPVRQELLRWLGPGLAAAATQLGTEAQDLPAAGVRVSTEAGMLEVTTEGAPAARLTQAEQTIAEYNESPLSRIVIPAVVAGVLAVLALVAAGTQHPRGALLLLFAAVVAALVVGYQFWDRRSVDRRRTEMVAQMHAAVARGQRESADRRRDLEQAASEAARTAEVVRTRLGSGV